MGDEQNSAKTFDSYLACNLNSSYFSCAEEGCAQARKRQASQVWKPFGRPVEPTAPKCRRFGRLWMDSTLDQRIFEKNLKQKKKKIKRREKEKFFSFLSPFFFFSF